MRSVTRSGVESREFSEVAVARGLANWYPLLGDALDYAGNVHAVNNGAKRVQDGYYISGSDSILLRPESLAQTFSICFWMKTDQVGVYDGVNDFRRIFVSDNYHAVVMVEKDYRISFRVPVLAEEFFEAESAIPAGAWAHVTCVYDQVSRLIYLNGELSAQVPAPAGTVNAPGLRISGEDDRRYDGFIRDVRIYDTALTAEEVGVVHKMTSSDGPGAAFTEHCIYTRNQFKEVTA